MHGLGCCGYWCSDGSTTAGAGIARLLAGRLLAVRAHCEFLRAARAGLGTAWACRAGAAAGQSVGALVAVLLLTSVKLGESVSGTCSKDLCRDWALIRPLRIIIEAFVSVFHLLVVILVLLLFVALALLLALLLLVVAALAILLFLFLVFEILNLGLEEFDLAIGGS